MKKCVRVTIIEDDIVEGDESFTIVIQSNAVSIDEDAKTAEVTIIDNSRKLKIIIVLCGHVVWYQDFIPFYRHRYYNWSGVQKIHSNGRKSSQCVC